MSQPARFCIRCGAAVLVADSRFCFSCGAEIVSPGLIAEQSPLSAQELELQQELEAQRLAQELELQQELETQRLAKELELQQDLETQRPAQEPHEEPPAAPPPSPNLGTEPQGGGIDPIQAVVSGFTRCRSLVGGLAGQNSGGFIFLPEAYFS